MTISVGQSIAIIAVCAACTDICAGNRRQLLIRQRVGEVNLLLDVGQRIADGKIGRAHV